MGEIFGKYLWAGIHGGTNDRSDQSNYQGRGNKMHFRIIFKSINCKSFPQLFWDILLQIKP